MRGSSARGGSGLRYRGSELGGYFFAQSAFATHAIATARNVVKILDMGLARLDKVEGDSYATDLTRPLCPRKVLRSR